MIQRIESILRWIRRSFSRSTWITRLLGVAYDEESSTDSCSDSPGTFRRGLVMIQIDGLSHQELTSAIDRREMPFLARLLDKEHYQIHSLYSGLPSSTPAVQGELFYGVKGCVPAFAFIHQNDGKFNRMYDPESAGRVEQLLTQESIPLLSGGSAYCDIYTGGAKESHFCSASFGWDSIIHDTRILPWLVVTILNLPTLLRTAGLIVVEFLLGFYDMLIGVSRGFKFYPEFKFIGARVAISILLRDLITIGAKVDIHRGLPIIHLNYLGYDEQAHRRGPGSYFAHWSLRGIDRKIQFLWEACHHASHRHYDVWIYSDHGQQATTSYEKLTDSSIQQALYRAINSVPGDTQKTVEQSPVVHLEQEQHQRARLLGGSRIQRLFPLVHPVENKTELKSVVVVAMGPVGHVYLNQPTDTETRAELARYLTIQEQVPAVLFTDGNNCVHVQTRSESSTLPDGRFALIGKNHPFLDNVTEDLTDLCCHEDAGDLILLGWCHGTNAVSFPQENGSHAGPGPLETHAFAITPEDTEFQLKNTSHLRPMDLRQAALHLLGRQSIRDIKPRPLPSKARHALRVMTYNVHSCVGMDSKLSPERIARVIARYQPDIVALQELDVGRVRTQSTDQSRIIAKLLNMDYHFHPALHLENERYGDAILTHLPMKTIRSAALPNHPTRSGVEPRGALWVSVCFEGVDIQIFNTHLGLFSAERYVQVNELMSERWLNHPDCTGPVIFCGDLNALPRSYVMTTLGSRLTDVQTFHPSHRPLNTFTGRIPTLRIDHILGDKIADVSRVDAPYNDLTKLASDHLPLIVDVVFQ